MALTLTGTIHAIAQTKNITATFASRDVVVAIDTNGQYPQYISFQLSQEKCSIADSLKTGDEVEVYFNLRGREWVNPQGETKYFNTLAAWKIEKLNRTRVGVPVPPTPVTPSPTPVSSNPEALTEVSNIQDLPF